MNTFNLCHKLNVRGALRVGSQHGGVGVGGGGGGRGTGSVKVGTMILFDHPLIFGLPGLRPLKSYFLNANVYAKVTTNSSIKHFV